MSLKKETKFSIKIGIAVFLSIYFTVLFCSMAAFLKPCDVFKNVIGNIASPIVFLYLKLLCVFILNGIIFGIGTGLFFYFLTNKKIEGLSNARKFFIYAIATIIALFFCILRQMIYTPTFFARYMGDKNIALQWFQYWVTDNLSLEFLSFCLYLFLTAFIVLGLIFIIKNKIYINVQKFIGKNMLAVLFFIVVLSLSALYLVVNSRVQKNEGPNLLMICIETLRSDHMSCNGYYRDTTTNIDMLAEKGFNFKNTFVSIARTSPSITSLLTGVSPKSHGITHLFPDYFDRNLKVDTLPRILRKYGYETVVVGDYSAEMFSNIDYGFDRIECPEPISLDAVVRRKIILDFVIFMPNFNNKIGRFLFPVLKLLEGNDDPKILNEEIIAAFNKCKKNKKFFIFAFYSAPHIPFNPVYPYYKMYTDPAYREKDRYSCRFDDITKIDEYSKKEETSENKTKHLNALYDGAIRSVDDQIGNLVTYLKKENLFEKTIIAVTGDHGEEFYENGMLGHGIWFKGNNSANRVPIIIHSPFIEKVGIARDFLVRNFDLMPTILNMLHIDMPDYIEGRSLMPVIEGTQENLDLDIFCGTGLWFNSKATFGEKEDAVLYPSIDKLLTYEAWNKNILFLKDRYKKIVEAAKHRMYLNNKWKLVYIPTNQGAKYQLFNVKEDPNSINNLIDVEIEKFEELKKKLLQWYF